MRRSIDRAQRFLGLTALLAAILAGVAIALGTRRFVERHLDGCAVMRCLGATQAQLLRLYGIEFVLLGVGGLRRRLCCSASPRRQPSPWRWRTCCAPTCRRRACCRRCRASSSALVLLLGFALPPLVQLKNVPAVRVIRRESGAPKRGAIAAYAAASSRSPALLVWQAGDLKLGLTVVGGFARRGGGVLRRWRWFASELLTGRRVIAPHAAARILRYGLANLRRHARGNAVQVASLALGLTAVLLLTFTRNDLVDAWRRSRAAGRAQPLPDRRAARPARSRCRRSSPRATSPVPDLYPMVRGRLDRA